ncbi:trypsin epsilon-like isoform X1 [Maniola jurtina]|uniref:trypsin epsilon-like isoform X1 n=1 Tax=Maniola jurtina TaxID=191418 RepID=UPI001E6860CA|nr:trypsin epsilon-like isoform X1 [Maniola jurtina]
MLYAVIKMIAVHFFLHTNYVECHLKDMGEVTRTNWTHILKAVESRIVGGAPASLELYPFMVQFYNRGGLCGGTILTSKTVMTAAHCFNHNKNLEEMKIFSSPRFTFDFNARIHEVWNFAIHEHYNLKYFFANDIAIIIIHDTFVFGPQVQKATLVDSDEWMNEKEVFFAAGWGETKYGEGVKKRGLRQIHLHYVSKEQCQAEHQLELGPEMFCLYGDSERDTCRGDSGGGILWKGAIVGIISHGRNCTELPGMYVKVNYFHSWIQKTVKDLYRTFCDFHKNKS